MSKGNRIVPIRIDDDMNSRIDAAIDSRNNRSPAEPWTLSSFIRKAIDEKLAHMQRSRRKYRPHLSPSTQGKETS